MYQDQHTFDIPELMECRGIKFCPEGLILARPFRKFFNYGERGADLPAHRPHYITHKMDGSMVHDEYLKGNIKEIAEYCCEDVETLRKIYNKLL